MTTSDPTDPDLPEDTGDGRPGDPANRGKTGEPGFIGPVFKDRATSRDPGKNHIALFIGSDVTSHLIINKILPELVERGYKVTIFQPRHKKSKKPEAQNHNVKDFVFAERWLLKHIVEPYLDAAPTRLDPDGKPIPGLNYTMAQLADIYDGVEFEEIDDINDPEFVARINEMDDLMGGISIRCYQIFHEPLIDAFREKGCFLWNVHPGPLPYKRGLFAPVVLMAEERREMAWTLHILDRGIDTGALIDRTAQNIDYSQPAIHGYLDFAPQVAAMILSNVAKQADWGTLKGIQPQNQDEAVYYSYPSDDDWMEWETGPDKGPSSGPQAGQKFPFTFVDVEAMVYFYLEHYTQGGTPQQDVLYDILTEAVGRWQQSDRDFSALLRKRNGNGKPAINGGTPEGAPPTAFEAAASKDGAPADEPDPPEIHIVRRQPPAPETTREHEGGTGNDPAP